MRCIHAHKNTLLQAPLYSDYAKALLQIQSQISRKIANFFLHGGLHVCQFYTDWGKDVTLIQFFTAWAKTLL